MKKLLYISLSAALLAACASAPPPDNDPARARAKQGYADLNQVMTDAIGQYVTDVKRGDFPNESESY